MATETILKIIAAIITLLIGLYCGAIELKKNSKAWLNRFFAGFYIASAIGFLLYTAYHIDLGKASIIIPIMIAGNIFFNFAFICLLFTALIINSSETKIITAKYFLIGIAIFLVSIFGYFIWIPTYDPVQYASGIIDTNTETIWKIVVNAYRMGILFFIIIRFSILSSKAEGDSKGKLVTYNIGNIVIFIGLLLNFLGGYLEVLALVVFDIGVFISLRSFLD